MKPIERLRKEVTSDLMCLETIKKVWPIWKPEINKHVSRSRAVTPKEIRNLGGQLFDIFKATSSGSRGQNDVSAGGVAWEALVCWYLNLCLLGSNTVVIKSKRKHIPSPISDCITVMYGSSPSNTESDLLAITFPDDPFLSRSFDGSFSALMEELETIVTTKFSDTELTVIQCKTNWNDNAQIPMLWDLIYSSTGFNNTTATVGRNNYVCSKLKYFSYAFATVPTVNPEKIKSSSVCVLRVSNLSGGNYWGLPSKTGVAMNLYEMINKNFKTSLNQYSTGWNAEIGGLIDNLISTDNYFSI